MRRLAAFVLIASATTLVWGLRSHNTPHHEFVVVARRYAFEPARLEVHEGDLVRITVRTDDIPHSFVIDALRIFKKATPDHPVTFELFTDRVGVFPFYCNLTLEDGCRNMKGELVVQPEPDGNRERER
jgi:heme/copper-type cytochrome/quinol oxidase subunit 2